MKNAERQTLAFLHDCALNKDRPLTETEHAVLQIIHNLLKQADEIIICLGGKAGRLGECIVGTALLEGTLQALRYLDKIGTPVYVFVDQGVADLFDVQLYCFNPIRDAADVRQCALLPSQSLTGSRRTQVISDGNVVVLDFHSAASLMLRARFRELRRRSTN